MKAFVSLIPYELTNWVAAALRVLISLASTAGNCTFNLQVKRKWNGVRHLTQSKQMDCLSQKIQSPQFFPGKQSGKVVDDEIIPSHMSRVSHFIEIHGMPNLFLSLFNHFHNS